MDSHPESSNTDSSGVKITQENSTVAIPHASLPHTGPLASDVLTLGEMYLKVREAGKNKVLKPHIHTLVHSLLAGM